MAQGTPYTATKAIKALTALTESDEYADNPAFNLGALARLIGCGRTRLHELKTDNKRVAALVTSLMTAKKDYGESKLKELMDSGSPAAVIFFNKTFNKDRGYAERTEITGAEGGPINVNIEFGDG